MRAYWMPIFITLGASLIGLAYCTNLHRSTIVPTAPSVRAKPIVSPSISLKNQLLRQERRVQRLRDTITQMKAQQSSSTSIKSEIENINTRMNEIKKQLSEGTQEKLDIKSDEQNFYRDQRLNLNAHKIILQNQLAQIETRLIALKSKSGTTPSSNGPLNLSNGISREIASLETQKVQLGLQLQVADLQANNAALLARQQSQELLSEAQLDLQELRKEYSDLQSNLEYWKKQQAALGDMKLRERRLATLEKELIEQAHQASRLRADLQKQ
jgi:membrane-associated HD superfamily phosphohydrolase